MRKDLLRSLPLLLSPIAGIAIWSFVIWLLVR